MNDPRFIPPSDREYDRQHVLAGARPTVADYLDLSDHAAYMDEQRVRDRDLIRRLAVMLGSVRPAHVHLDDWRHVKALLAEARGIEADNA